MRNLLKYEFRKSRTGTLVLLGLLGAIEALFLGLRVKQIEYIASLGG